MAAAASNLTTNTNTNTNTDTNPNTNIITAEDDETVCNSSSMGTLGAVVSVIPQPPLMGHDTVCTSALFRPQAIRDMASGGLDGTVAFWDTTRPRKPTMSMLMTPDESARGAETTR